MSFKRLRAFGFFLLICSCGDSIDSPLSRNDQVLKMKQGILDHRVLREEFHLGEYSQRKSDSSVVSVLRDEDQFSINGIVEVQAESGKIMPLIPNHTEAKNLLWDEGRLVYRIEGQVFLWDGGSSRLLWSSAENVQSFVTRDNTSFVFLRDQSGSSLVLVFDSNFKFQILRTDLDVLNTFLDQDRIWIAAQDQSKFSIWELKESEANSDSYELQPVANIAEASANFVSFRSQDSQIYISFLNENEGCLYLAALQVENSAVTLERVDGEPGLSYVGMDLMFFDGVSEKPGMIYLDAWKLRNRMAIWNSTTGSWQYFDFGLLGSFGFYNTLLSENEKTLDFVFHSFRDEGSNKNNTFENLHFMRLDKDWLKTQIRSTNRE